MCITDLYRLCDLYNGHRELIRRGKAAGACHLVLRLRMNGLLPLFFIVRCFRLIHKGLARRRVTGASCQYRYWAWVSKHLNTYWLINK